MTTPNTDSTLRQKLETIMYMAKIGYDTGSNWQYDTIIQLEALIALKVQEARIDELIWVGQELEQHASLAVPIPDVVWNVLRDKITALHKIKGEIK